MEYSKFNETKPKNRVFYSDGLGIGKNNPISLHTDSSHIYRVTGFSQIADIINCGYVRPKEGVIKGGHKNEVFWSLGGEKTFYYDKRPVLETIVNKVKDGQLGSLSLEDLTAIWIFDNKENKYIDKMELISQIRETYKNVGTISKEQIEQFLSNSKLDYSAQIENNSDDVLKR
jgi:hypothetical protein